MALSPKKITRRVVAASVPEKPQQHHDYLVTRFKMFLHQSDEDLMLAYQNGNVQAFQILLMRHQKPLYLYLLCFLKSPELAEEVLQEVSLEVVKFRDQYRPNVKFTKWLYTLAKHCCLERLPEEEAEKHLCLDQETAEVELESLFAKNKEDQKADEIFSSQNEFKQYFAEVLDLLSADELEVFLKRESRHLA